MSGTDDTIPEGRRKDSSRDLPAGLDITLEAVEGEDHGKVHKITSTRTVLGRKNADLIFDDPTVSGNHAILEFVGGRLFITDNNSTNGTKVNGEPIENSALANMDVIQLGELKLLLSVVEDKYGSFISPVEEETEESRLVLEDETITTKPLPNPEIQDNIQVILDAIAGPDKGKKFKLTHRSTVIGRAESADMQVVDPTISKKHCQIEIHNKDKMTIKDLASANGTKLNDKYISAVKIRHGDLIRIGDSVIKILINIRS